MPSYQSSAILSLSILPRSHSLVVVFFLQITPVLTSVDDIIMASKLNGSIALPSTAYALFPSYSALVLSQMNTQQFDVVTNAQSFKIVHAVKSVVSNAVTVSSPLTTTESAASVLANTLILSTATGTSSVKVAMLLTRISALSTLLSPLVHSDPVLIMLSDTSVCSTAGCTFQMVLQSVDNTTYNSAPIAPVTYSTLCGLTAKNTVYSCSNGLNVTAKCDGKSVKTLISTCGYTVTSPACGRISTSGATQDVCTTVSYSKTQTTCQCVVPTTVLTSSSRKLMEISSNGFALAATAVPGKLQIGTVTNAQTVAAVTTTSGAPTALPTSNPNKQPSVSSAPTSITPSTPSTVPTPGPTANTASYSSKFSGGIIAAAVIFSIIGCAIIILVIFVLCRRKRGAYKKRKSSVIQVGS